MAIIHNVLEGDIIFTNHTIDGDIINGNLNKIPVYDGSYNVVPSSSEQILQTSGKQMSDDITVEAVNTYTGEYTITPSTNQQIIATDGKMMEQDLTVNAVPVYQGQYSVSPSLNGQTLPTENLFLTSDITVNAIPQGFVLDLMFTEGNKGFRTLTGSISGNGTDPNWLWWDLVSTDGFTKLKYYIMGYSTVASIMWFDSNRTKMSEMHGSTVSGLMDIPAGASYVAISTRVTSTNPAQYVHMY